MTDLTFAFVAGPGRAQREALVLARSIREFAGSLSGSPILVLVPGATPALEAGILDEFAGLGAEFICFEIDPERASFPFADKVHAAAAAETVTRNQSRDLLFMDSHSLVLDDPGEVLLEQGHDLGCRPVDHKLIGSPYDEPVDAFWQLIYDRCGVPEDRLFPMTTTVDGIRIRPYFNAGFLVVRPERGLFELWRENFDRLHRSQHFEEFYRQDPLYRIFVHQAILAGSALSQLAQPAVQELPRSVNYPLHMHADHPPELRPESMNDLISCRYDTLLADRGWQEVLPAREPLRGWLAGQLGFVCNRP